MATHTFDVRLALCFAAVAQERSFTGAARRLGVAQPWVSEQLRKLEDQLGYRLLDRTSRKVELTPEGAAFLPYALGIERANDTAQLFAAETRKRADQVLKIGAVDFSAGLNERLTVVESFVARHPEVDAQIHGGVATDVLARLKRGDVDVAFLHRRGAGAPAEGLESVSISHRYAHILAPPDDPLAAYEVAPLSALRGRTIAVSPGRSDPVALALTFAPLEGLDVTFVAAPEPDRNAIERFAKVRRLVCFHWEPNLLSRREMDGFICVPIEDAPLVTELTVVRRAQRERGVIEWFWAVAQEQGARLGERLTEPA
ncbi:MAG: transcriptional regulator, LysR family [Caulobacter sp.]|nr:transcriptional regulator, LysR family [Caulobacter sp.]